jgi:hypothetical protein
MYAANPAGSVGKGNDLSSMFVFRTPWWAAWNEVDIELEPTIPSSMACNVIDAMNARQYPAANASPGTVSGGAGYANTQMHVYAFQWTKTSVTW